MNDGCLTTHTHTHIYIYCFVLVSTQVNVAKLHPLIEQGVCMKTHNFPPIRPIHFRQRGKNGQYAIIIRSCKKFLPKVIPSILFRQK